jgi:hypothetical protein
VPSVKKGGGETGKKERGKGALTSIALSCKRAFSSSLVIFTVRYSIPPAKIVIMCVCVCVRARVCVYIYIYIYIYIYNAQYSSFSSSSSSSSYVQCITSVQSDGVVTLHSIDLTNYYSLRVVLLEKKRTVNGRYHQRPRSNVYSLAYTFSVTHIRDTIR